MSADLSMIASEKTRTQAEAVFSVLGKTPKAISTIVDSIKNKYKKEERHLTVSQVKTALKALTAIGGLVSSENLKTGTKGRPPLAYKLFQAATEAATA